MMSQANVVSSSRNAINLIKLRHRPARTKTFTFFFGSILPVRQFLLFSAYIISISIVFSLMNPPLSYHSYTPSRLCAPVLSEGVFQCPFILHAI